MSTHSSQDDHRRYQALTEYARALRAAIADAVLERQGVKLRLYVDNDVAISAIKAGNWLIGGQLLHQRLDDVLVRALFSTGYYGKVHMVWPHIAELWETVKAIGKSAEWFTGAQVQEALRKSEVEQHLSALRQLEEKRKRGEAELSEFEAALQNLDQTAFAVLEAVSHRSLPKRVHAVMQSLDVNEQLSPRFRELEGDPRFLAVIAYLRAARNEFDGASRRTLIDGAAIVGIMRAREEAQRSRQCVRFFTQTRHVRAVCCRPEVGEALCDSDAKGGLESIGQYELDAPGFALRSTTYMLIRGIYDVLALEGSGSTGSDDYGRADRLMEMGAQLTDILMRMEDIGKLWEVIGKANDQLRQLSDQTHGVVKRASNLSFAQTVWLDSRRRAVGVLAKRFHEVSLFEELDPSKLEQLREALDKKQDEEVTAEMVAIASVLRDYRVLERRVERAVEASDRKEGLTAFSLLAASRWSGGLTQEERGRAIDWLHRSAGGWKGRNEVIAELTQALIGGRTPADVMVGAIVAWNCGLFDVVAKSLGTTKVKQWTGMPELELLRCAADCVARGSTLTMSAAAVLEILKASIALAETMDAARRSEVSMAAAWVAYYWLWGRRGEGDVAQLRQWAVARGMEACAGHNPDFEHELAKAVVLLLLALEPTEIDLLEARIADWRTEEYESTHAYLYGALIWAEASVVRARESAAVLAGWSREAINRHGPGLRGPLEPFQVEQRKQIEAWALTSGDAAGA